MEVKLSGTKILKILIFSLIALFFLTTFTFLSACKQGGEIEEGEEETEAEDEKELEEYMEDDEGEDMDEEETEDAGEEEQTVEDIQEEAIYMDITAIEAKELIDSEPALIIIDVSPHYDDGHIPGALHYYGDNSLDDAIPSLDKEKEYLVYCHADGPSISAANKLAKAGFTMVYRLEGNYQAWVDAGYPIET